MKIQIPNPCQESWRAMQSTEKGAFCKMCQKEVYDFRHMTDRELKQFFEQSAGKVCGRFRAEQLNHNLSPTLPARTNVWARTWLGLSLYFAWAGKAEAKPTEKIHTLPAHQNNNTQKPAITQKTAIEKDTTLTITGTLKDAHGETLPGASILVPNTLKGTNTDEAGKFKLVMTLPKDQDTLVLKCSYIGYRDRALTVNLKKMESLEIILEEEMACLGVIVARPSLPRRIMRFLTSPFRRRH